jgi:hypothetical protein
MTATFQKDVLNACPHRRRRPLPDGHACRDRRDCRDYHASHASHASRVCHGRRVCHVCRAPQHRQHRPEPERPRQVEML